jgi:hypothetical protein
MIVLTSRSSSQLKAHGDEISGRYSHSGKEGFQEIRPASIVLITFVHMMLILSIITSPLRTLGTLIHGMFLLDYHHGHPLLSCL